MVIGRLKLGPLKVGLIVSSIISLMILTLYPTDSATSSTNQQLALTLKFNGKGSYNFIIKFPSNISKLRQSNKLLSPKFK